MSAAETAVAAFWSAMRTGNKTCCPEPVTHEVTAGCVHEHIVVAFTCAVHVELFEDGSVNCLPCLDADDWHICPLRGRTVPLGERAIPLTGLFNEATGGGV